MGVYAFRDEIRDPLAWRNDDFEITRTGSRHGDLHRALGHSGRDAAGRSGPRPARRQRERAGPDHLHEMPCDQPGREFGRVHARRVAGNLRQHGGLPTDQVTLVDYLAKNFPEKPRPRRADSGGPVSIKEWVVPTLGSRPHDPLATPDGSIWYTGKYANVLGRVDPKTGEMKEFPLKTPASGPHGLTVDKNGNIWFTANSKATSASSIRRPGITDYKLPDRPRAIRTRRSSTRRACSGSPCRAPTWSAGSNPKTGEIKLVTSPHATVEPVRHGGQLEGHAVVLSSSAPTSSPASIRTRWRSRSTRCRTPEPSAPHRHHARRRDLVLGLFARLSRPVRSQDRRGEGMAVARAARTRSRTASRRSRTSIWYSESA